MPRTPAYTLPARPAAHAAADAVLPADTLPGRAGRDYTVLGMPASGHAVTDLTAVTASASGSDSSGSDTNNAVLAAPANGDTNTDSAAFAASVSGSDSSGSDPSNAVLAAPANGDTNTDSAAFAASASRRAVTNHAAVATYASGSDTLFAASATGSTGPLVAGPHPADPYSADPHAAPPFWRDTTAAAVYGTLSVREAAEPIPPAPAPSLTDNAVFQSFVLVLAATYATLLYRNLGDVRTLLSRISREGATAERLVEDPGRSGFSRFLHVATAIGMLFMGVVVVKYGDSLMPRPLVEALSHGAVLALSLLATLVCCAVALYQLTAVRAAGAVTLAQPFISQLVLLKRTYFALAVIVTSPALLLFALCPRGTGGVWFSIVAVELAVAAVLYLRETLNLFLSKKISILHWFLYLCTVEIFPISLLWLLAAR